MDRFDGVDSVLRADPRAPLAHERRIAIRRYPVKRPWNTTSTAEWLG
jgi:hypothetical protein